MTRRPEVSSSLLVLAAVLAAAPALAQPAPDGPPVVVASATPNLWWPQHDVDMTPDGRTVVVFLEYEPDLNRNVVWRRTFDAEGRPGRKVPIAVYDGGFGSVPPVVAAAADGGFLAGWQDLRRPHVLRTRRFDGDGRPAGTGSELTADGPWAFDLCATGDGFVAAWTTARDVRVRLLDGAGAPRGAARTVAAAAGGGLELACNREGRFAVVWNLPIPTDYGVAPIDDLWIRTFAADGRPLGRASRLLRQPRYTEPIEKTVPAMSADGSVAVAWRYRNVIQARFFSPDGRAPGPARKLARLADRSGRPGAGAVALADDTFFIYWAGKTGAPYSADRKWLPMPLYGQSFDTAGQALDEPRPLTSWWAGWYSERVASDGRGHLAFVWDDADRHLLMQRFSIPGPGRLSWTTPRLVLAEGHGEAVLSVARTGGCTGTVSVDVAAVGADARAGADFEPTRATLTFPDRVAGEMLVRVPLRQDRAFEESEAFAVALSTPTGGAELGDHPRAVVEIRDDDWRPLAGAAALRLASRYALGPPAAALDAAGGLYAAWRQPDGLVARHLDAAGDVRGEIVVSGGHWTPPVLASRPGGGAVLVTQRLLGTGGGRIPTLETSLLTYDAAAGWQGPFALRAATSTGGPSWIAAAPLADGGLLLLGLLDGAGGPVTLSRWDARWQPLGEPVRIGRISAYEGAALAAAAAGDAVAAWSRLAEIEAVWLPAAPERADAAEVLTLSAGPPDLHGGPTAVALADGRFLVAWHRVAARGSQIVGRILTPEAAGSPAVGPEIVLSTTDAGRGHLEPPSLAAAGELLLAAWSVRGLLYVQLFDGSVRPLGGELRTPGLHQGPGQTEAKLVANAAGEAAVLWTDRSGRSDIGLRRLIVPSGRPDPPPERERPEQRPERPPE